MKELTNYISKQYTKHYTINNLISYDIDKNCIVVDVTRKDNGWTFTDVVRLDINIKQVLRDQKLNQLGI